MAMVTDRVIALLDMDCFYVQVEQRAEPVTWGQPCAVVQYTGGGVIAVNYEARAFGIRRGCRVPDCKNKCPNIRLFWVPEQRGKADLTKYRNASNEVFDVLLNFHPKLVVERASIDEAYLDLTELVRDPAVQSYEQVSVSDVSVAGTDQSLADMFQEVLEEDDRLVIASKIIQLIRNRVKEVTNFTCSAGVSHNKVLAKLCAGFKKPNGQSVLPASAVTAVFSKTPIEKVRGLGGKLGQEIKQHFGIEMMIQIQTIPSDLLEAAFGQKTANYISDLAKGNDEEAVTARSVNKSVGCGKNFPGLKQVDELKHWFDQLTGELVERLNQDRESNNRSATNVTVNVRHSASASFSRTLPLKDYQQSTVIDDLVKDIVPRVSKDGLTLSLPIISLSLVAGKFMDQSDTDAVGRTPRIDSFFSAGQPIAGTSATASTASSPSNQRSGVEQVQLSGAPAAGPRRGFFYRKTVQLLKRGSIQ
jgi:DNA polymerase eta